MESTGTPSRRIGERLSHYTLLEELHRGDTQIVYRARDEKLGREVALKVLPPERVQDVDRRRERFVAEAKAAASLEHPHIGVIHEIDESDGVLYIAMELMRGSSLADRLARGPLSPEEALPIAIGVASGLAHAHERGVVHRDVKPANVMLTAEGHPKLIDFGLAKLLDVNESPFLTQAGEDEAALQRDTREGVLEGTANFMSPEQARGGKVDARSDLFSFGLVLYAMLSGRPPFTGPSRIDILHAILREPTPRLANVSGEARELLQPIIDRCLQKEPDRRYPSATELVTDLRRVRRELESGEGLGRRGRALASVALLAGAGLVAVLLLDRDPDTDRDLKPSIAILRFENLSGDQELDWLVTGLPDMLATDLAQSPEIEVAGLDDLAPVLAEIGALESQPPSRQVLRELAARTGVRSVLLGSFAKSGESIRISARLEDPESGRVLLSEKAEAVGEENVFRLVDEITGRIKSRYQIPSPAGELDRDLRDVSTASLEAYREYAEGIRLHERYREEEAVPHFQRAIELDPEFAMALAKLGVVMSNLGHHEEADEYAELALENVNRLSDRERLYIEGWYLSRSPETFGRALESYERAIARYPDHGSARHNLANLLFATERYDDAIQQFEELRRRGMLFPATYEQLASAYQALDDVDSARRVLREFNARNPDDWNTVLALAQLEIQEGRFDEAEEYLSRAESLGASPYRIAPVQWAHQVLREDWDRARETAVSLSSSAGPVEKFLGGRLWVTTALYRGEVEEVLSGLDRYLASPSAGYGDYLYQPLLLKARVLLETGDIAKAYEVALEIAEAGEEAKDSEGAAQQALALAAIAAERLGDGEEADDLRRQYRQGIDPALGAPPRRLYHFLEGELATARGNYRAAISQYEEAESMLPPRGSSGIHTTIWYSLANAHRLAGNRGEATDWYRRIVDSAEERLFEPILYVRSFYHLGELYDAEDDLEEARWCYRRFLDHWEDGDFDRELVRRARSRLR